MLRFNNKLIRLNGNLAGEVIIPPEPPAPSGYQYFLWYVERNSRNASSFMQQDLALYDLSSPSTKITGFTALAGKTSSNPGSENYPNGVDGNENSKWYSNNTWANWVIFTNNNIINPVGFSYMTSNDQGPCYDRSPINYKLCGSNVSTTDPTDSNWTVIYQATDDLTFYNVHSNKVWVDKYFS